MRALQGKPEYAVAGADYRINITDNSGERQFDLELVSMSNRDLCLGLDWPDDFGQLAMGSDYVTLRVGDRSFPMNNSQVVSMSLEPIEVPPGASLLGFIGYDQFPGEAFALEGVRTLDVRTSAHFCDTRDRIAE